MHFAFSSFSLFLYPSLCFHSLFPASIHFLLFSAIRQQREMCFQSAAIQCKWSHKSASLSSCWLSWVLSWHHPHTPPPPTTPTANKPLHMMSTVLSLHWQHFTSLNTCTSCTQLHPALVFYHYRTAYSIQLAHSLWGMRKARDCEEPTKVNSRSKEQKRELMRCWTEN